VAPEPIGSSSRCLFLQRLQEYVPEVRHALLVARDGRTIPTPIGTILAQELNEAVALLHAFAQVFLFTLTHLQPWHHLMTSLT